MRTPLVLSAALVLAGCAAHSEARPAAAPTAAPLQAPHFIEDDYASALATARAANEPLFVDAWAPW